MFSDIRDTVNRVGTESLRIKNFASVTEKATASRGTVISMVNRLDTFLKEQHERSRGYLKEGLAKAEEAAAQRGDVIDQGLRSIEERLGEEMERRQKAMTAGLEGITDGVRKAARETTADLEDLIGRVNMQLEGQATSVAERFAGIEARFDRLDNENSSGLEQFRDQLSERLDISLNQRCDSLEESFTGLAEKAHASNGTVTSKVNQLDAFLKEEHESTRGYMEAGFAKADEASLQTGDRIDHSLRAVEERTAAGLEELSGNLDSQIERQAQSLAERFAGIEARLDRLDHDRSAGLEQFGDQLEERLDVSWKERCDSLEESVAGLTEKAHASSGNVISKVNQLDAFLKEEHESWHASLEAGFAKIDETSLQTGGRIDQGLRDMEERLGGEMERRQEALSDGLEGVSDSAQRAVRDTAAGLEGLGKNLNQQIEGQLESLAEKFTNLEARLDQLDLEHSSGLEQLADRLGREFADGSEALQENLKATAEITGRKAAELATGLERHDRLEELVLEQLCDFESLLRGTVQAPGGATSEPNESLNQDGSEIEQELDVHTDALANELMALDEFDGEGLSPLEEPDAEWCPTDAEWAQLERDTDPGNMDSPDESTGDENETLFCTEPLAPFGTRKSKDPVPFGQNVDWDWSGLEDDTDRGDDPSSEIPPALPGVPQDAQDNALVKQPAGDSDYPTDEGSDAPLSWPDQLTDSDADEGPTTPTD
jgi:DNA anti-recombination protein RmuC